MAAENKEAAGGLDLNNLLNRGLDFGGSLLNRGGNRNAKPAALPAQTRTNYTPWVIGGAVALVVVLVAVFALRK